MFRANLHFEERRGALSNRVKGDIVGLAPFYGLEAYAGSYETTPDGYREYIIMLLFEDRKSLLPFIIELNRRGYFPVVQVLEDMGEGWRSL